MTDEEIQQDIPAAVSEQPEAEPQHQEEQTMVPLAALQAERRKRQEFETRTRVYEEMLAKKESAAPDEPEDPNALLTQSAFREEKALTKREILEQIYQDMNPEAVEKINTYLKPILDKKPWLAATIDTATNRLARANEIVDDYIHLVKSGGSRTANPAADAQRIVQNSQKPRSTADVGKTAQLSGVDYLKSIQGKKEFREYRQKMLRGEV